MSRTPPSSPDEALKSYPALTKANVQELASQLERLTESQREWVKSVIRQFQLPNNFWRNPASSVINNDTLEILGDALRIHHAFSRQALSKDRFEFALEKALNSSNIEAQLANSRTNRGHDITIRGVRVSLKTEAASNIKEDLLHISKFMELGKGEWVLDGLRTHFFEHMVNYERIYQFRCIGQGPTHYKYELVEIPKKLLEEAANGDLEICENSRQNPKPGYCRVKDAKGERFALYFDGGTERKLQIKNIRKALCVVHATWQFESAPL